MVDCISTKLPDAQLNYDIYDLEMLAIIQALEEWQHYLYGQEFEIHMDHQNLAYFWKPNPLNGRQNRWRQFLSLFDFKIVLRAGKSNAATDALSRRPDHGETQPRPLTTLLLEEHFWPAKTVSLLDEICDAQKTKASPSRSETDSEGLLRVEDKIWVPSMLTQKLFELHHSSRTAVHPGI